MTLEEFARLVPQFGTVNHAERIRLLAWWLHEHGTKEFFTAKDIAGCYSKLHISPPADITSFLRSLEGRDPKHVLRTSAGFRLERTIHDRLTEKYGKREATIHVEKLLTNLPNRVPNLKEQDYLQETLKCLRAGAFRAAVVMAWNLAYDHVCEWILADTTRLADFNAQTPKSFPKMGYPTVVKRDDFMEFKESHVLQIAKSGRVITDNLHKILKEKLDRRNVAAHPSDVKTLQPTAEEVIRDLVENVVLKLT